MSNLILKNITKILVNIKEVFTCFDNSAFSLNALDDINQMLKINRNKTNDSDVNIKELLESVKEYNNNLQSAFDDAIMRASACYAKEQSNETRAICELIKARIDVLQMILEARV